MPAKIALLLRGRLVLWRTVRVWPAVRDVIDWEKLEATMKPKFVGVETTRYSEFFHRVFEQYADEKIVVMIDQKKYNASDIPLLVETWCTNAKIKSTRDFCLWRDKNELFSFHDHPEELFASVSELPFLNRLVSEKIIRIHANNG